MRSWYLYHIVLGLRKPVFGDLPTTKAQTTLHIAQSDQRLCYSLIGNVSYLNLLQANFSIFLQLSVAEETCLSLTL